MSVRTEEERDTQGNKVSAMFTSLATDVDDPLERIQTIATSTAGAKEDHNAVGARTLTDWAEWATPRTFGLAARLYSSMNLANSHRPVHNLVISNVPGPPFPLYVAGARLMGVYPFGPLIEGSALNITVLSNMGNMDIGIIACPEVAPDIDGLVEGIVEGIEVLRAAAEREATRQEVDAK